MFKRTAIIPAITMALGLFTAIPLALAQLAAVDTGPYLVARGYFPQWYREEDKKDTNGNTLNTGESLDLCLSKATNGTGSFMCTLLASDVFDPAKPIAFPANFPDESFWMLAEATTLPTPPSASNGLVLEKYIAGVEAAFAAGGPKQGLNDQVSFARIRIRATVPVAGTYTVIHPYGVETFKVTTTGRKAINMTRDIGIGAAGDFSGALMGNVGPFLRSVKAPYKAINPDTGKEELFIGDPAVAEAVTGSPFGTNFVRIEGPNGISIQTNLFNLSGKLFEPTSPDIATDLGIDRATYSRDADHTWISVFANSNANASLCFRESLDLVNGAPCLLQMDGDNGRFFGQDQKPADSLPPFILVTAESAGTTATSQTQTLTDVVKISSASYSWSTRTLTVNASSSDEVKIPAMVAPGFGSLSLHPVDNVKANQRLVANIEQPPATITVRSAAGGSDTEPVSIEGRAPMPTPPVVNPDSVSVTAGTPAKVINVLANDSGTTLQVIGVSTPVLGSANVDTTGIVTYTPPDTVTAISTTSFTYQVRDARGATATGIVNVTVEPATQLPPANQPLGVGNDSITVTAGAPASVVNVLGNDSGTTLQVIGVSAPVLGSANVNATGIVTYTPPDTVTAISTTSFTYQVQDASGATATGTVNVTVQPNLPPANPRLIAVDDAATTRAGVPVTINVLANDSGSALTVVRVDPTSAGLSDTTTDGTTVTYTPQPFAFGPVTFTYQVQDSAGATATATVTVTVTPLPVAADTLTITRAQFIQRSNDRFSWDIRGNTTGLLGNQIRIEVASTTGPVLLGTVTPTLTGSWRLLATNSGIVLPPNPSITARSSFGAVTTQPLTVK